MEHEIEVNELAYKQFLTEQKVHNAINKTAVIGGAILATTFASAAPPDMAPTAAELTALIGGPIAVVGGAKAGVRVAVRGWYIAMRMI